MRLLDSTSLFLMRGAVTVNKNGKLYGNEKQSCDRGH